MSGWKSVYNDTPVMSVSLCTRHERTIPTRSNVSKEDDDALYSATQGSCQPSRKSDKKTKGYSIHIFHTLMSQNPFRVRLKLLTSVTFNIIMPLR
jgi:hypothetical protein